MSTILLVEDDKLLGRAISTYLEKAGFEVKWVMTGEGTFGALANKLPHLILLDIMLPDVDGLRVLEQLKRDQHYKQIPVVMLTNLSDSANIESALRLGANDYVIKSNMDLERLAKLITARYLRD